MTSPTAADERDDRAATGAHVPKYYLLKQDLLRQIDGLVPGQSLPSERELSTRFSTSRTTVRQALQELAVEGRLQRLRGSGTFVAKPKLAQALQLTSYTEDMRAQGLEPSSRLLHVGDIVADDQLARLLEVPVGSSVLRVERLRMADGEPMAVETTHLSNRRFPRLRSHLKRVDSLYAVLADIYGVHLAEAEQTIETVLAGPHEAATLGTEVGLPLLLLSRHSRDEAGSPVEYVRSFYRGDRYKFVAWLHRPGDADTAQGDTARADTARADTARADTARAGDSPFVIRARR